MKKLGLNNLFDCYSELLTENERKCFIDYYSEDLSLSEIATNNNVSRSAVGKTIKTVEEKLNIYEKLLNIHGTKIKLKEISDLNDIDKIKDEIQKIID